LATELRPWHTAVLGLSVLLLLLVLAGLAEESIRMYSAEQREAIGQPVPEHIIVEARELLDTGDGWQLVVDGIRMCGPGGESGHPEERMWTYYWLGFRLAPAVPSCDDAVITIVDRGGTWEVGS
jgi:hypothetical protein